MNKVEPIAVKAWSRSGPAAPAPDASPIRGRWLRWLPYAVAIVLWTIAWGAALYQTNDIEDTARHTGRFVSSQLARSFQRSITILLGRIDDGLAFAATARASPIAPSAAMLAPIFLERHPMLLSVAVVDEHGAGTKASMEGKKTEAISVEGSEIFRRTLGAKGMVFAPSPASADMPQAALTFARAVRRGDGSFIGAVLVEIDRRAFLDLARIEEFGPIAEMTLVDTEHGVVLARVPQMPPDILSPPVKDILPPIEALPPEGPRATQPPLDAAHPGSSPAPPEAPHPSLRPPPPPEVQWQESPLDHIERAYAGAKVAAYPIMVVTGISWVESRNITKGILDNVIVSASLASAAILIGLIAWLRVRGLLVEVRSAKDRAEAATQTKSEFLANMSHEIRTPINAIAGFTSLTQRTELTAQQSGYVENIRAATQGLTRIVNDLLDFSKIEAGHLEMEAIPFALSEIVDTLTSHVGPLAEEKGLELLVDLAPDVPAYLVGDPLRLGQILINIGSNAVKFTEHGEIELRVSLDSPIGDKARLRFAIRDTGIGLSDEQAKRLFQAFTQADTSTTRKFGGTGLGLVICQRLVSMMNGRIWLESKLGEGSTFFFVVEIAVDTRAGQSDRLQFPASLVGQPALVVDDNDNARQILCVQLAELGMAPRAVAGGQDAVTELRVASAAGRPYPLVLIDWKMPDLDGVATIRAIRSDSAIAGTPAMIMVTAFGRERVLAAVEDKDMLDGVLLKPVTHALLSQTLRRLGSKASPAERTPTALRSRRLLGARILLVEDNPINQQLTRELLEQDGAEVAIAGNGLLALDLIKVRGTAYFDIALVDLQMPEMDGFETVQHIRQLPSADRLPLIAMTAHAMREDRDRCLAVGMQDHIGKPIDPDLLVGKVAQWIRPEGLARAARRAEPGSRATGQTTETARPTLPAALSGVDMAGGLRRCGNNTALYRSLLIQFHDDYAGAASRLEVLCASGQIAEAYTLAHSIKGAAANLGIGDTASAAAEIELFLKRAQSAATGKDQPR